MKLSQPDHVKRIFDERMKRLAAPLAENERLENNMSVIIFLLGQECYAMELAALQEILPFDRCTPLPTSPAEVLGVMNVRGNIRAVLSLKQLLGLPGSGPEQEKNGYVLFLENNTAPIGLRADKILAIKLLAGDRLKPLSEGRATASPYLRGWTVEGVTLLEPRAFLDWTNQR